MGFVEDDTVEVKLDTQYGHIVSEYKINDLNNPIMTRKENEEGFDTTIKQVISVEELEELTSKARSINSVFEEIADEYNESLKENLWKRKTM